MKYLLRLYRFVSENKLSAILLGSGVALLVVLGAGYYLQHLAEQAEERRNATSTRLFALEKTLTGLQDAQIAHGALLITGNEAYGEQFETAARSLAVHVDGLARMYESEPTALRVTRELERLRQLKTEEMRRVLEVYRQGNHESARAMLLAGISVTYTVAMRSLMDHLKLQETEGLAASNEQIGQRRRETVFSALLVFLVASTFGALAYVSIRREAGERQLLAQRLQQEATHDALTGLANRRSFMQRLERELARAQRTAGKVAVFFIDLDGFKRINDELGHGAGDAVLVRVAECFRGMLRESDFLARLGGDEFALLVEVANEATARALAERLIDSLVAATPRHRADCGVSASVGIAIYPLDATDGTSLLSLADSAMYLAKRAGKGRAIWAGDAAPAAVWAGGEVLGVAGQGGSAALMTP